MKIPQNLSFDRILTELAKLTTNPLGKFLAENLEPSQDLETIKIQLEKVTELKEILDAQVPFPVRGVKDILKQIERSEVVGVFLSAEDFLAIAHTLQATKKLHTFFKNTSQTCPNLKSVAKNLVPLEELEKKILSIIDETTSNVKDSASHLLQKIRSQIRHEQNRLRTKITSLMSHFQKEGFTEAESFALREGKLVIPLKAEHRNKLSGATVDFSQTGSTVYVEPLETIEISNSIRRLEIDEKAEVERILTELTAFVRNEAETLETNLYILAELDFIHAKALFSQKIRGNAPHVTEEKMLFLDKVKHPVLCLKDYDSVVPLTLKLDAKNTTLVITGPNAGGKTVAMKTVGLCALMVQSGLHVPSGKDSIFPVFDNIFAEIGDSQSIENDLSTFSSHIFHLKNIYENFTGKSLILVDEIMSGTDPNEGSCLAMALLESFTRAKTFTIATTHHGSLKAFAYETEGVENGSMEFDAENLKPTYNFRIGIPGSSYAFEIAQRFGFSDFIIKQAKNLVGNEKMKLENLISELNQKLRETTELRNQLEIKTSEQKAFLSLYKQRSEQLASEKLLLKKKAAEESAKILNEANATVELAIREIKEKLASKEVIKEAKELLSTEKAKVEKVLSEVQKQTISEQQNTEPGILEVGSFVKIKSTGIVGKIVSKPDSKGKVMVETDLAKVKILLSELEKTKQTKTENKVSIKVNSSVPENFSNTLDLRGFHVEEALPVIDKFLYYATEVHLNEVTVIHGIGTGILKEHVTIYLKNHHLVKSTRYGNWNEGSAGATIVTLV
ncbi:endonuclease MutS2 [bacterium]|nr:endonuclease MutS2 [bacterium]